MNFKNWNKQHTYGLMLGIVTPLLFMPLVILFLAWMQSYSFDRLWHEFTSSPQYQVKIITISIISNLISFYYFLNREKYHFAMGIILASIAYAPYVIYVKFF